MLISILISVAEPKLSIFGSASDPYSSNSDPDPAKNLDPDPEDPRIRIRNTDFWLRLHFSPYFGSSSGSSSTSSSMLPLKK